MRCARPMSALVTTYLRFPHGAAAEHRASGRRECFVIIYERTDSLEVAIWSNKVSSVLNGTQYQMKAF